MKVQRFSKGKLMDYLIDYKQFLIGFHQFHWFYKRKVMSEIDGFKTLRVYEDILMGFLSL